MAKKIHIRLKYGNVEKVYCGLSRSERKELNELPVNYDELWAVKKTALCKKCVANMKAKLKKG